MHVPEGAGHGLAQAARCLVEGLRDAAEAGLDRTGGDRQEPGDIGVDQRRPGPDQQQPGRDTEPGGRRPVDHLVEGGDRDQDADRDHRARHGIAQGGQALQRRRDPARPRPGRVGDDHAEQQHGDGRDRRQDHGVDRLRQQPIGDAVEPEPLPRLDCEIQRRGSEADQDRNQAERQRREAGEGSEPVRREAARALRRGPVALPAAGPALDRHQGDHQDQHGQRDLRRTGQVRARHPGGVDRDGQRPDPEELGCADVVQRLHQRQADADRDGRPGQRQRHPPEHLAAPGPERARHLDQIGRLGQEHRPGGDVDIGVQHEAQQHDATGHRPDVGQPELARTGIAQQCPDRALDDAERMQDVEIGIGDDVGRHRQRQQQRPFQLPAAREVVGRDQPGRRGADRGDDHADADQQHGRLAQRRRQHIGEQVRPQSGRSLQRLPRQSENRHGDQRADDGGGRQPAPPRLAPGGGQGRSLLQNGLGHRREMPGADSAAPGPSISRRSRPSRPARWPVCGA